MRITLQHCHQRSRRLSQSSSILFNSISFHRNFVRLYTELAHAHYEPNTMRSPSRSRPQLQPTVPTRSSHFSSRAKAMHLAAPILPSCKYSGNLAHKANECNIPSKDLFCDYCGKDRHHEVVCFANLPE